jgi:hypothetical protein
MTRAVRTCFFAATIAAGSAYFAAEPARADVSFQGTFAGPHGFFSIGVGSPRFPVGSHVPRGHRVFHRARYGYGFWSPAFVCSTHHARHAHWIPVRRHRARWIVVDTYDGHGYGYGYGRYNRRSDHRYRSYEPYEYGRYERRYGFDDRGYYDGHYRDGYRYDGRRDGRRYRKHRHDRYCDDDD